MSNLERHSISAAFGDATPEEFQELKDRIEAQGVQEPIVLYDGQVLDGWQRLRAATELHMDVPSVVFSGEWSEAVAFVMSKHTRRSMTPAARAAIAIRLAGAPLASTGRPKKNVCETPFLTKKEVARAAGVSVSTMSRIMRVERNAIPDVKAAMLEGKIEVASADSIARLSPLLQRGALDSALSARTESRLPMKRTSPKSGRSMSANASTAQAVELKAVREHPTAQPTAASPQEPSSWAQGAQEGYTKDELIETLREECDRLTDRLALHFFEGTDEEKAAVQQTIESQRIEIQKLQVELSAVKDSRDSYARECNELKRQCRGYQRVLRQLRKEGLGADPQAADFNLRISAAQVN